LFFFLLKNKFKAKKTSVFVEKVVVQV